MEEDLVKIEGEIGQLKSAKQKQAEKPVNMEVIMESIKYYLEHFEELLLDRAKPLKSAEYFSLVFNSPPTYQDLVSGTPNLAPIFALKPALESANFPIGGTAFLTWN